ncbi:MAG TPA: hypothetical protein VK470_04450 [Bacteroidota bacterium]|nr:hypothetical protein [Bacteroidota bacterium]
MKKIVFVFTTMLCASAFAQEAPHGKFSGYMFGDYFYNVQRDTSIALFKNTAVNGARDFQGFQLRRIYFTYDNEIAQAFTTRFRLESTTGSPIVKDAYLKWKNMFAGSDLYFGVQPTPAYDISESAWGYRSLEKTIMDLRGIVPSRDLGVSLRGKLTGDGSLNYWVMVGNNSGTNAETDKFKRYYVNFQIKPVANLQATLYADYAAQPAVNDPASVTIPKATVSHSTMTTAVFVGYGMPDRYNLGVEGFLSTTEHDFAKTGSSSLNARSAMGISVFGSLNLSSDLSAVARFDLFNPNTDSDAKDPLKVPASVVAASLARNYLIASLVWKADKNVSIMPNIQYETNEKAANAPVTPKSSVTARVTFYYIFL